MQRRRSATRKGEKVCHTLKASHASEKRICMSIRKALECSLEDGQLVRVVVREVEVAIREVRRIWGEKLNWVVTDDGTEVWGWTRWTPKNQQDFRLLIVEER
jgi:hypothetical protein